MLMRISGVLVPLASVTPLISLFDYGEVGGRAGYLVNIVAMAGGVFSEAVVVFLLLRLILLWLRTDPSYVWKLDEMAAETRVLVAEDKGQQSRSVLDPSPNEMQLIRELYGRRERENARISRSKGVYVRASTGLISILRRPLMSARTAEVNARIALYLGLVVDVIWPRIQVVLPSSEKREVALLDRSVAVSRVVAASAACTVVGLVIDVILGGTRTLSFPLAGVIVVVIVAVLTARRRLGDAYERRAMLIELYRFDLLRAMRLESPRTSSDLVKLGGLLMDGVTDERVALVSEQPAGASAIIPNFSNPQLDALLDELSEALPERIVERVSAVLQSYRDDLLRTSRVEIGSEVLGSLAELLGQRLIAPISSSLAKEMNVMQREILSRLRDTIQESVAGEPLVRFDGFMAIDLLDSDRLAKSSIGNGGISVSAGRTLRLRILVFSDERARDRLPQRESRDALLVALQPVQIDSNRTSSVVDFEVIIDSPTLTAVPHRLQLRVPEGDVAQDVVSFDLQDRSGAHEAWIQLYQLGRLVEVIALPIEVQSIPSSTST